jgi:hypothetical protein
MPWTSEETLRWNGTVQSVAPHIGLQLARAAFQQGLAVTNAVSGETTPIPVSATPVVIAESELRRRQQWSTHLASAGLKMATAMMGGLSRELVAQGLSPLELSLADSTFQKLDTLVNARVDFFIGDTVKALELNATIPAMQGYSDIASHQFIEAFARHFKLNSAEISRMQAANGSNALALLTALRAGFRKRRNREPHRIALLCRRNDAQLTEQHYLAKQFTGAGIDADVVYPDQLQVGDDVKVGSWSYDLIYRHLFIRRLDEPQLAGADTVKALLAEPNGTRAVILNGPATHVEAKSVFALLSSAVEDSTLQHAARLTADELDCIATTVPWTRMFRGEELLARVAAEPNRYVLKRSWDYGGRAVFVGAAAATDGFATRAKTAFGQTMSWAEVCAHAAVDRRGGGFIVQEMVTSKPSTHLICGETELQEMSLYVDFSTYASVGLDTQPAWGGVCRGSVSPIVNIVGGGGVLPLLTEAVASRLYQASVAGEHAQR